MALELTIVTPEGEAFASAIESVVLPGTEGEFGVLEAHERLLTALQPGPVEIRGAGGAASQWAAVTDGFVEVTGEHVVVLVHATVERDGDTLAQNIVQVIHTDDTQVTEIWEYLWDQQADKVFWSRH